MEGLIFPVRRSIFCLLCLGWGESISLDGVVGMLLASFSGRERLRGVSLRPVVVSDILSPCLSQSKTYCLLLKFRFDVLKAAFKSGMEKDVRGGTAGRGFASYSAECFGGVNSASITSPRPLLTPTALCWPVFMFRSITLQYHQLTGWCREAALGCEFRTCRCQLTILIAVAVRSLFGVQHTKTGVGGGSRPAAFSPCHLTMPSRRFFKQRKCTMGSRSYRMLSAEPCCIPGIQVQ